MHTNPAFRTVGQAEALNFARQRGFGILTINGPDGPLSAHVPFVIRGDRMLAHLTASNPIWRALADGPCAGLVSVSGPDSYVSPDWYRLADQVPTWNYIAVNLRGTLCAMPQDALPELLDTLTDAFETRLAPKPAWSTEKLPDEVSKRLLRQIRPVSMTISEVESTFKLGQNKPEAARLAAADAIETAGIGHDTDALAARMRDA